jgi:hypothetical protein
VRASVIRFFSFFSAESRSNMHERERYRAALEVANTTATSGRSAAEQINRGMRPGKSTSFRRIVDFIGLASLAAAGLIVTLAAMPAQAEEGGGEVPKEIAALQAKAASLQETVSALQGQIASLQNQLAAVQSNLALALGPFVSIDANSENGVVGPFKGAARDLPATTTIPLGQRQWRKRQHRQRQ